MAVPWVILQRISVLSEHFQGQCWDQEVQTSLQFLIPVLVRGWLSELLQSFYRVGPRDQTQVLGLRSRCLLHTKTFCWPGTTMSNMQRTSQLKVVLLPLPQQPGSWPRGSTFRFLVVARKCCIHNQLFVYPLQVWNFHSCIHDMCELSFRVSMTCVNYPFVHPWHVWIILLCIHDMCELSICVSITCVSTCVEKYA